MGRKGRGDFEGEEWHPSLHSRSRSQPHWFRSGLAKPRSRWRFCRERFLSGLGGGAGAGKGEHPPDCKVSLCASLPAARHSEICPQLCLHLGPRTSGKEDAERGALEVGVHWGGGVWE